MSNSGTEVAQRLDERRAVTVRADEGHLREHERPSAQMLRQERSLGELQQAADRVTLLGHGVDPLPPGVQDLRGPLDRPQEAPGVELRHRVEGKLERGDGAEVPPATTHGPEQIGLVLVVGSNVSPVGRDDLGGQDAVRSQAVLADHPAEAPAQDVAEHPDVG